LDTGACCALWAGIARALAGAAGVLVSESAPIVPTLLMAFLSVLNLAVRERKFCRIADISFLSSTICDSFSASTSGGVWCERSLKGLEFRGGREDDNFFPIGLLTRLLICSSMSTLKCLSRSTSEFAFSSAFLSRSTSDCCVFSTSARAVLSSSRRTSAFVSVSVLCLSSSWRSL
jgi:hypothetical protein